MLGGELFQDKQNLRNINNELTVNETKEKVHYCIVQTSYVSVCVCVFSITFESGFC